MEYHDYIATLGNIVSYKAMANAIGSYTKGWRLLNISGDSRPLNVVELKKLIKYLKETDVDNAVRVLILTEEYLKDI